MKPQIMRTIAVSAAFASGIFAQNYQRQASIVGGGGPNFGRCTVEVVVDGVAQVEMQGASATLRTLSGQPAQWRRFECTGAMPGSPANFRFAGVDGRGRQELIRDPRNGGAAVVQIEDRDGGAEGYTFDISWGAGGPGGPPNRADRIDPGWRDNPGDYRSNYRDSDYYRRYGHGFTVNEAIRVCQQSVSSEASRRYRTNDIHFNRTTIDDNPGRQDWVMGSVDVHRGRRTERYGFSCSVNFDNGRVRSTSLDPRPQY